MPLTNFNLLANEQVGKVGALVLECVVVIDRFDGARGKVKFWIDPKSLVPLKRELTLKFGGVNLRLTEIYSECVIDLPLATKLFGLPPGAEPRKPPPSLGNPAGSEIKHAPGVLLDLYGDPIPKGAIARLGTERWRCTSDSLGPVAYSADGKLLVSGSDASSGGCLYVWDAFSGQLLHRISVQTHHHALAFSPDGKSLISENWIIDVDSGEEVGRFGGRPEWVTSAACSPDGKMVAKVQYVGKKIRVVLTNVGTGKEWRRFDWSVGNSLPQKGPAVFGPPPPAFSPDGNLLATGSLDKTIRLWDVATCKEVRRLEGHEIDLVAFAPNGKVLASLGQREQEILMWDVLKGTLLRRLKTEEKCYRLVFSPQGDHMAWTGLSGMLHLCDTDTGGEIRHWQLPARSFSLTFSPDGKTLATSAMAESVVHRWDTATGKEIGAAAGHSGSIGVLLFASDGKTLLSGGSDRKVEKWDLTTKRNSGRVFLGPLGLTQPGFRGPWVGISPRGKVAAVGASDFPGNSESAICLYDTITGQELHKLRQEKMGREAKFTPDGKLLATYGKDGVRLWEVATGKVVGHLDQVKALSQFAFSPDGKRFAVGSASTVSLCEVATGKEIRRWDHHVPYAREFVFSPDGTLLAYTNAANGSVGAWSTDSGKQIPWPEAIGRSTTGGLAFSPSGRCLAVAVAESVQVWEVLSGQAICEVFTTQGSVSSLAFSPDGRTLASGGSDSTILLWDMTGQTTKGKALPAPLNATELDALWSDLGADAVKADQAIWAFARVPEQGVALLTQRLRPVAPADDLQVAALVADLNSDQFAVRKKAAQALAELGEKAESQLRDVLKGKITLELRQRVGQIVTKRDSDPELIRRLRAIESLEHVGTPQARQVLEFLVLQR